jgi:hypothetical protein
MIEPLHSPEDVDAWRAWADDRLGRLDLSLQMLHDVVEAGQRGFANSSPLGPKTGPGFDRWEDTLVAFRERTGWPFTEEDLSRTYHPSEEFYVVVKTGADGVGQLPPATPTPKNGLGKTLQRLIGEATRQQTLIKLNGEPWPAESVYDPKLWILMTEFHDGQIFCELSKPKARSGDKIVEYVEQIPIPPLPFNMEPIDLDDISGGIDHSQEDDGGTEIDIDVKPL